MIVKQVIPQEGVFSLNVKATVGRLNVLEFCRLVKKVGSLEEKCLTKIEKAFRARKLKHWVAFGKSKQILKAVHFFCNWSAKQPDSLQ